MKTKTNKDLINACKEFVAGWAHFCSRINWANSTMDAEAIRFMNEVPPKIGQALKKEVKT